jgi:hypothetical protein
VQDTSRIHCRDRDALSLVLLAVPGMAALGPDRAFKVLLCVDVVITDDGVFDGNRSGYVSRYPGRLGTAILDIFACYLLNPI